MLISLKYRRIFTIKTDHSKSPAFCFKGPKW